MIVAPFLQHTPTRQSGIPKPAEGVKEFDLSTPAGWHILRSGRRGTGTPAGCNILLR